MKAANAIIASAGIVAMGSALSKLLGFARESALALRFGATSASDAYLIAMIIPTLLLMGIGPAVTAALIPVFSEVDNRRGRAAAYRSANTAINACLLVSAAVTAVGIAAVPAIVRIIAPGFSGETYSLTVRLSVTLFPIAIFSTLSALFTGLLQALGKFTAPAMVGLVQNVIIISSILHFGPRYGITAVAVGTVVGTMSHLLIQLPSLIRSGYRYQAVLDIRDEGFRRVARLIVPIIAGTVAGQAGTVILRMLASRLPEGSITSLNYAQRLVGLPQGILGTALVTVLYPTLSRIFAGGAKNEFLSTYRRALGLIAFLMLPMAAGLISLSIPIVRLAFERGAFTPSATLATASALVFLSLGLPAMTLGELTVRTYYSMQDTITPVIVGVCGVALNAALSIILVRPMGHMGLALASSAQFMFSLTVLYIILRRRMLAFEAHKPSVQDTLAESVIKSLTASTAMGIVVYLSQTLIGRTVLGSGNVAQAIRLAVSIGLGGAVYLGASLALGNSQLQFVMDMGRTRLLRRASTIRQASN